MKTLTLAAAGMMFLTLTVAGAKAQTKGNGNVTTQERQVSSFDAIKVGSAINLVIKQGDQQSVSVQTDENLQNHVIAKVTNGILTLNCENMQNPTKMDVFVTAVKLKRIDVSGAAIVTGETPFKSDAFSLKTSGAAKVDIQIETDKFDNETSGAAKITLALNAKTAKTQISGAGNMILKGSVEKHSVDITGAGNLKAMECITDFTDVSVSGAGNADVMVRKQLKTDLSGAGSITYMEKGKTIKLDKHEVRQIDF